MLTPLDIQNAAFHRAFRGYNEEEVDSFLDRVFLEYEQLYRENLELKERAERTVGRRSFVAPEVDEPRATTVQTPESEESLLAGEIIADAKRRAEEIIAGAQQQVAREKARLEELKQQRRMFKEQFKALLQTFFHILKDNEEEQVTESTIVMRGIGTDYRAEASVGTENEE